jgi:hypothetical protein
MFHFGDPQPIRPRDSAQPYPRPSINTKEVDAFLKTCLPSDKSAQLPEKPLALHALQALNLDDTESEGLPIYHATVYGRNQKVKPIAVETIIDTAAADTYISRNIAMKCKADIFPLAVPREVVGAGQTITLAFAKFMLCIGNVKEITMAYVLEEDSGFRYDLLLGRNWMKKFNVLPNWADNSFELTSPKTHQSVRIKAARVPVRIPSPLSDACLQALQQGLFIFGKPDNGDDTDSVPDLESVSADSDDTDDPPEPASNNSSWDDLGVQTSPHSDSDSASVGSRARAVRTRIDSS